MLENKKLNMILSLLIVIALWAFVIGEVNPEATRTYRDVPIQFLNEETLDEYDLAVYAISDTMLSVTLTGTRSDVNQVELKDIVATVDLDQATIGENSLRVDVKVPSKVDVEGQSLNKVTVTVENRVSREVNIRVRYNGSFEGEQEPLTIDQSMTSIWVSGAETNINNVDHVEAVVDEGTVTEKVSTFACRLVPVDKNINKVYNVDLEVENIEVTAELSKTKTVPLEVPIVDDAHAGYLRNVEVPETITLKGQTADLELVTSITAEAIDISQVNATTTMEIVPILPEGVQVSSKTEKLVANVQVVRQSSKDFNFSGDDVAVINLGEGLVAKIKTKNVQVSALGNQDVVSSMNKEAITLTADLSGLKAGEYSVTVMGQCTSSSVELQCKPEKVVVIIEAAENNDLAEDSQSSDTENTDAEGDGQDSETGEHPDGETETKDGENQEQENKEE